MDDSLEELLGSLSDFDGPWYKTFDREGNLMCLFPRAEAVSDESWEAKAIQMHDSQVILRLAPKPVENTLQRATRRISRGD